MEARIIQIGNSRGIRIPKTMLEQAGMTDKVELSTDGHSIMIVPANAAPRSDWKTKFGAPNANEVPLQEDSDWLNADLDVNDADAW
jgi:antitoxin MazE